MKSYLFAAIVILNSVQLSDAQEVGRYYNKTGGAIIMDEAKCDNGMRIAYATSASGAVEYGCWLFHDNMIHVRWENGTRNAYDLDGFILSERFNKKIHPAKVM